MDTISSNVRQNAPGRAAVVAEILMARPLVEHLARQWTRDPEAAADLVQDTVERALNRLNRYRPGTNPAAWLRSIMYHLAVDQSRRFKSELRFRNQLGHRTEEAWPHPGWADEPEAPPVEAPSLEETRLTAARLREPLRGTFLLWLNERLSYQAISRRQGIPLNTVGTRLRRARLLIRQMAAQTGGIAEGDNGQVA